MFINFFKYIIVLLLLLNTEGFINENKILVEEKVLEVSDNQNNLELTRKENIKSVSDEIIGSITFENGSKADIYNNPSENLNKGVSKLLNNSILNERGNSIILGHNNTEFSELENIKVGDVIKVNASNKELLYIVNEFYVTSNIDARPYKSSNDITLTLITCYPFNYLGYTTKRYVVIAKLAK